MNSILYTEKQVAKHLSILHYVSTKNQEYGVIPGHVLSVISVCNPKLFSSYDYWHSVVHCRIGFWGLASKGPLLCFSQMFQGL